MDIHILGAAAPETKALQVLQGVAVRVPRSCRGIRVLSGSAWVTMNGLDIFLRSGEQVLFKRSSDCAVISTDRCYSVSFEIIEKTVRKATAG